MVFCPVNRQDGGGLFSQGRPLPGGVNQRQKPNHSAVGLVDETIVFMDGEFARAGDFAGMTKHRMASQPQGRIAEQFVHANGGLRVVGNDIVPNIGAVSFRFGRPDNFHVCADACLRRLENLAST